MSRVHRIPSLGHEGTFPYQQLWFTRYDTAWCTCTMYLELAVGVTVGNPKPLSPLEPAHWPETLVPLESAHWPDTLVPLLNPLIGSSSRPSHLLVAWDPQPALHIPPCCSLPTGTTRTHPPPSGTRPHRRPARTNPAVDLGGPRYAGLLCGVSNTVATIPGIVGNVATGAMLETGGWSGVFGTCVVLYLIACGIFCAMAQSSRLKL